MTNDIPAILSGLKQTEHGFKHIIIAGDTLLKEEGLKVMEIAVKLIHDESYQGRMLGKSASILGFCGFHISEIHHN